MREEARSRSRASSCSRRAADRLGIEVSDEEVEELVREQAEASGEDADAVLAELRARRAATSGCARICACATRSTGSPPR